MIVRKWTTKPSSNTFVSLDTTVRTSFFSTFKLSGAGCTELVHESVERHSAPFNCNNNASVFVVFVLALTAFIVANKLNIGASGN